MASRSGLFVYVVSVFMGLLCLESVFGRECATGDRCRQHDSCRTQGVVYCCPNYERLVVNGSTCLCNEKATSSGVTCIGERVFEGYGYQLLDEKPDDDDCRLDRECEHDSFCQFNATKYCCLNGRVEASAHNGKLVSCSCSYNMGGSYCTGAASNVTSLSGLTCALALFLFFLALFDSGAEL